ncbi:MAG: SurA N-terminal domain-containing protein, partial [Pseudomonadota bacterium]|nr:SurA N-terminal domain-containing protein [Pseudomonadota bacterium]
MLDEFRSISTNIAAKLLMALLVLSFAVWGIGDMVRGPHGGDTIATVGGTKITARQFDRAMQQEVNNLQQRLGGQYSPEILKELRVPRHVARELIDQRLIQLEAKSAGLVPDDAAVAKQIRSDPEFRNEQGKFDKAGFDARLANKGMTEKAYVSQVRRDMASRLLLSAIGAAVPDFDEAARMLYAAKNQQREATFYRLTPQLVSGVGQPTAAEEQAYYKSHEAAFTVPEYRRVSYVTFSATNLPGKPETPSESELREMYQTRISEFKKPE